MESLTQAAFDGVGRYQAEGPPRAFEGLSWTHGKGSGAQALFGQDMLSLLYLLYQIPLCHFPWCIIFSYISFR